MDQANPDPGREAVTKKRGDLGKFKVPTLRDLAHRAPYMHDGSIKTLGEVLDFYAKGGLPNPHLDTRLTPFYMDEQTKAGPAGFSRFTQRRRLAENHPAYGLSPIGVESHPRLRPAQVLPVPLCFVGRCVALWNNGACRIRRRENGELLE